MLMTAALSGKADAVRLLLTRGATVDTKEPYRGQTALMWAAAEGNTAAVEVLLEAGADLKLKSNGGLTPLLCGAQRANRDDGRVAEARRQRQRRCAGWLERAEHRERERLLRAGIGAAQSWREPEPARPARLATPYRGVAAQARRRRRRRRREHARGYAAADRHGHRHRVARKLLAHGAHPNTRVQWNEPRFGKKGGTTRNPPNIRLGRHLLSYRGATRSTSPRRTAISS